MKISVRCTLSAALGKNMQAFGAVHIPRRKKLSLTELFVMAVQSLASLFMSLNQPL